MPQVSKLDLPPSISAVKRSASRKVLRRLEQIEALPPTQQTALLRTMDVVLKGRRHRLDYASNRR